MARFTSFNGARKAIAANTAQTIQFAGNDLPSSGVVKLHFRTEGTDATLADFCTNVRVKADSLIIWDCPILHLRKLYESFNQANATPATTGLVLTLDFSMFDIIDDDIADRCQFPRGTVPTVEFTTTATVGDGTDQAFITAGWTMTDQPAQFYPQVISTPMNIAASATNAVFPLSTAGMIRAGVIHTAGLSELTIRLNAFDWQNLPGSAYGGASSTKGDMVLDQTFGEDAGAAASITTAAALRLPMSPAASGTSHVKLTTGSGWGGTGNPFTTWAIWPQ